MLDSFHVVLHIEQCNSPLCCFICKHIASVIRCVMKTVAGPANFKSPGPVPLATEPPSSGDQILMAGNVKVGVKLFNYSGLVSLIAFCSSPRKFIVCVLPCFCCHEQNQTY